MCKITDLTGLVDHSGLYVAHLSQCKMASTSLVQKIPLEDKNNTAYFTGC